MSLIFTENGAKTARKRLQSGGIFRIYDFSRTFSLILRNFRFIAEY